MFKDLRQFKAYLGSIDNFDQMYYIQQGGRGVTQQQIINRLQSAIKGDLQSTYTTNKKLWDNLKVDNINQIEDFEDFKVFINSPKFSKLFSNNILITK